MGWIEFLRLIAEDQNRASAQANQEAIQNLAKAVLFNQTAFVLGITFFSVVSIVILLICNSQSKKIKQLQDSIQVFQQKAR